MLKIQLKNQQHEPIWIVDKIYTIGSAVQDNLTLPDDSLSAHHAELITQDNTLTLNVLSPSPACGVNGIDLRKSDIRPGDTIHIGSTEITVLHPFQSVTQPAIKEEQLPKWSLTAVGDWLEGQTFVIPQQTSTIGRSPTCDIVIPGTHLSRQHAELTIRGNTVLIRDLASSNGTFINGKRISEAVARAGDKINFDVNFFKLNGPNTDHHKTQVRDGKITPRQKPKPISSTPKKWITKPTSPGNRVEPAEAKPSRWPFIASLLLCIAMTAAFLYLGMI